MTLTQAQKRAKSMSESVWFTFLGRLAAIAAVPLMMWQLGKLDGMERDVQTLKATLTFISQDPYHGQDAKRDLALRDQQITSNSTKLLDLDSRVKTLELGSAMGHR